MTTQSVSSFGGKMSEKHFYTVLKIATSTIAFFSSPLMNASVVFKQHQMGLKFSISEWAKTALKKKNTSIHWRKYYIYIYLFICLLYFL